MEVDRVGTLVGYSSSSQIPIDGGINSTQSQWAPARRSLGEHINQGSLSGTKHSKDLTTGVFLRFCKQYFSIS